MSSLTWAEGQDPSHGRWIRYLDESPRFLDMDLGSRGLGVCSRRYSALWVDGVVRPLDLEEAGSFTVSDAETRLKQIA